jgi:SnoaL-like domain
VSARRVIAAAALLALTLTGCGSAGDGTHAEAASRPPTLPPQAFADAVRAGDLDALKATFADDIRLYSPVLTEPFIGRDRVDRLFDVLIETFRDIHITHELRARGQYALSFTARVGSEPIRIVDLLEFDESGHIKTFTVTGRPLAGVQALGAAVAPHLAEIG